MAADTTGISSAYGGVLSALEIVYTLTPKEQAPKQPDLLQDPFSVVSDGLVAGQIYLEREEVHAIYEGRRQNMAIDEREILY